MNVEQEISGLKESRGWQWLMIFFLLLNSCAIGNRLRKLEPPAPKPEGGLMLPTFPHSPHVRDGGDDHLAMA